MNIKSRKCCIIASFFLVALLAVGAVTLQVNPLEIIKTSLPVVVFDEVVRRLAIYKLLIGVMVAYLFFCFLYSKYEKNKELRDKSKAEKILL